MQRNLIALLLIFSVFTGKAQSDKSFEVMKNLEIFSSAYKQLHLYYVDETNPGDLMKTGIDQMLQSLDPYTVFIPEADVEDYKIMTMGHYGGIGSLIHYRNGFIYISEPYEGSPALKAGLMAGDKIIRINGQDAKNKNSEDVSAMLKGQAGTKLELEIERSGKEKPLKFEITREEIKLKNVQYYTMLDDKVGYILQTGFTQDAANEVKNAFLDLKKKGMQSLILDLRGNGGGLMNEAIDILGLFCPLNTEVVNTKGKDPDKNAIYKTKNPPIDLNIPIVVMVNRNSASASEIVAGALQDLDRAVIVGQRSFGKGLVQNIMPLEYNAQMKITVAKYYIPSGRCVQALDYEHRDEEGKVHKVPDSLRKAFQTKNGRTVFDGDGIQPDIELEPKTAAKILVTLVTKYYLFDYATEFRQKHSEIASSKDFVITDSIWKDFGKYLSGKDYSYKTSTEDKLEEIIAVAKEEDYYNAIKPTLDNLQKELIHDKEADLKKNEEDIKEFLRSEIVSRYYYQSGRAETNLTSDEEIKKAISVLNDKTEYGKLLK